MNGYADKWVNACQFKCLFVCMSGLWKLLQILIYSVLFLERCKKFFNLEGTKAQGLSPGHLEPRVGPGASYSQYHISQAWGLGTRMTRTAGTVDQIEHP